MVDAEPLGRAAVLALVAGVVLRRRPRSHPRSAGVEGLRSSALRRSVAGDFVRSLASRALAASQLPRVGDPRAAGADARDHSGRPIESSASDLERDGADAESLPAYRAAASLWLSNASVSASAGL